MNDPRIMGIDIGLHGIGIGWIGGGEAPIACYLPNKGGRGPKDLDDLATETASMAGAIDWLVIERMQIDDRTGSAEADALIALSWLGGLIQRAIVCDPDRVVLPSPGEWTNGVPKNVRIARLERRLTKEYGIEDPRSKTEGVLVMPSRYAYVGGRSDDAFDGLSLAVWQYDRLTGRKVARVLSKRSR